MCKTCSRHVPGIERHLQFMCKSCVSHMQVLSKACAKLMSVMCKLCASLVKFTRYHCKLGEVSWNRWLFRLVSLLIAIFRGNRMRRYSIQSEENMFQLLYFPNNDIYISCPITLVKFGQTFDTAKFLSRFLSHFFFSSHCSN